MTFCLPAWFRKSIRVSGGFMLLLVLLAPHVAKAQTATGAITGTITDPNGLLIEGASVVVHNTDPGSDATYPTNGDGLYSAPYLQPGNYEVTASKSGFESVVSKGVVVHVGVTLTIDLQLPLQAAQTSITVTAEAPVLETEKTAESQDVSEELVEGLPTLPRTRSIFLTAQLSPLRTHQHIRLSGPAGAFVQAM